MLQKTGTQGNEEGASVDVPRELMVNGCIGTHKFARNSSFSEEQS